MGTAHFSSNIDVITKYLIVVPCFSSVSSFYPPPPFFAIFLTETAPEAPEIMLISPSIGNPRGGFVTTLVGKKFLSGFKVRFFAKHGDSKSLFRKDRLSVASWFAWSTLQSQLTGIQFLLMYLAGCSHVFMRRTISSSLCKTKADAICSTITCSWHKEITRQSCLVIIVSVLYLLDSLQWCGKNGQKSTRTSPAK